MKTFLSVFGFIATTLVASGDLISVHNTGVGTSDVLVSAGGATAYWELSGQPSGAGYVLGSTPFRYHHTAYAADLPQAAWVSPGANGYAGTTGFYTYSLTIDLTGLDSSTAHISGRFSTDNNGSIGINGSTVATTGFADFGALHGFVISSGFLPGLNTLEVRVNNGGDPTAFIVVFDSATADRAGSAVPDSGASLAFAMLGLAPLLLAARARA